MARTTMNVRIHAFEPVSRANGPGRRAVVWFQGCSLGCPKCFNPETHAGDEGESVDAGELALRVLRAGSRVEGVTFSGGEPSQQPSGLLEILAALASSHLTMLCFSGYTLGEIRRLPLGPAILDHLDVLVAGRYAASRPAGWRPLPCTDSRSGRRTNSRYAEPRTDAPRLLAIGLRPGPAAASG